MSRAQMKTQKEMVLNHLIQCKTIDTWEAITKYKITRLARYIELLRLDGYAIASIPKSNNKKRWTKYLFTGYRKDKLSNTYIRINQ